MLYFNKIRPLVIGMVHVHALPGSPGNTLNMGRICGDVRTQTLIYKSAGVDSILIENMNDLPYVQAKDMGPETVAYMTSVGAIARKYFNDSSPFYQTQMLTNSLQILLKNLPKDVKESADNATISKNFTGGEEVQTASFPNFKETGHGKTESEARLKGILEIYANYLDKEKLISNEHKKMKDVRDEIQGAMHKFLRQNDIPYLGRLEKYCHRTKSSSKFALDTLSNGLNEYPLYHGKLFIDGKLAAETIENKKDLAHKKCVNDYLRGKIGVQILAGANKEALAVAHSADLDYIRAEGFVFSHVADEGWMDACAGQLLRYRNYIGANNIQIFTDIKKKHSAHAVTSDVSLVEMAKAAEFFGSDGVIITGTATGEQTNPEHVQDVISNVSVPVLVGSGVNSDNVADYKNASAVIVGSHFKRNQDWRQRINIPRLYHFMVNIFSDEIDFDKVLETDSDSDLDVR